MKVKVSFKDDVGLSESRTSDAEGTVAVASGSNNVPAFSGTTTTRRCCARPTGSTGKFLRLGKWDCSSKGQ